MSAKEKKVNFVSQFIKIFIILGVGVGLSAFFLLTKPAPTKKKVQLLPLNVSVESAVNASGKVWVEAMGIVSAVKELKVVSEVGGRVTWINEKLIPGGVIAEGETILKIEKTDYEIAVEQAKANLATAQKNLLIEEGAARSAKVMEDMSKISASKQARELRMRVPHIQAAEANLVAAEKLLEQAQQDLVRTDIIAPFAILIESENIEIGNYVTRLSTTAEAVGTDAFWVEVTLPISKLPYLSIPGVNAEVGSNARVTLQGTRGTRKIVREGRVVRLSGRLDSSGRMAKILIEVEDPLGIKSGIRNEILLLNSYVKVDLEGKDLAGMIALPREYLREGDVVWVMNDNNKLEVKKVDIAWRDQDMLYLSRGLKEGDRVITSRNFVPVEGMTLSLVEEKKAGKIKVEDAVELKGATNE